MQFMLNVENFDLVINELLVPKLTGVKRCIGVKSVVVKTDNYNYFNLYYCHTFTFEGRSNKWVSVYNEIELILKLMGMSEYANDFIKLEYE